MARPTKKSNNYTKEQKWKINLYKRALNKYGINNQLDMMIEECSELIQAICKLKRQGTFETLFNIFEELADVEIMLEQMKLYFGSCDKQKKQKLERLEKLINRG